MTTAPIYNWASTSLVGIDDYKESQYDFARTNLYDIVYDNSPLLQIRNQKDADNYIQTRLSMLTHTEQMEILFRYIGFTDEQKSMYKQFLKSIPKAQYGGQPPNRNLYDLIMIKDSIHDFANLAQNYYKKISKVKYPSQFYEKVMNNTDKFVEVLCGLDVIPFENENVPNPFYGLKYNTYDLKSKIDADPTITKDSLVAAQRLSMTLNTTHSNGRQLFYDIWSPVYDSPNTNKKQCYFELAQLADFCNAIKFIYKDYDNNQYNFLVDTTQMIARLITGLRFIDISLYKQYFYNDTEQKYYYDMFKEFLIANAIDIPEYTEWSTSMCDANIYDGNIQDDLEQQIDYRPTGSIYSFDDLPYQITLGGIKKQTQIWHPNKVYHYKYTINIDVQAPRVVQSINIPRVINNDMAIELFSKTPIKDVLEARAIYNVLLPSAANIKNTFEFTRKCLENYDIETLFALKRAGDLGYVVHCKRYKKILITHDKTAAIMAKLHNVPCILCIHSTSNDNSYNPLDMFTQNSFIFTK